MLRDKNSEAYRLYSNSVVGPSYASIWHHGFGPRNGTYFWTSQLEYLRGLDDADCASSGAPRLIPICTERMEADLRTLLRSDPAPVSDIRNVSHLHFHFRWRRPPSNLCKFCRSSRLSGVDASYVRGELFPWDSALHKLACGTTNERHRQY